MLNEKRNITRITPQDAHKEMLRMCPDYPEEWPELDDEQKALFVEIARNLNKIVDGESVKKLPTRRYLIRQHQKDLDELANKPTPMRSWTERFMEDSIDQNMIQYHKAALNYLENGGDIEATIDALSAEELEDKMRSEGYFICCCDEYEA